MPIKYKIIDVGVDWIISSSELEETFNRMQDEGYYYVDCLSPGIFLFFKHIDKNDSGKKERNYSKSSKRN